MPRDSHDLLNSEATYLFNRTATSHLLLELEQFLERLGADTSLHELLLDMKRDADDVVMRFKEHDTRTIEELRAIRNEVVEDVVDTETDPVSARARYNLGYFDRVASSACEITTVGFSRSDDPSRSKKLILGLRVRLADSTPDQPNAANAELVERVKRVEQTHDHEFRKFSQRCQTSAGFALDELRFICAQVNPAPEHETEWRQFLDERYASVIGHPALIRTLAHGEYPTDREHEITYIDATVRNHVRRVCEDLERRLGSVRSRVGLLNAYALRCSWYDAVGVERLVAQIADDLQKEDRLAEHLALYLFDQGMRPLTRAAVGRLVPDLLDPEPAPFEPSFYVEAKQYIDRPGALRAIRDGARQIWGTAARLRPRYALDEAFLVFFRRGGPMLRFAGDARRPELRIRPVLVDVAPGRESGHSQREIIDVSVDDLIASTS